jgi:hypothetical protein
MMAPAQARPVLVGACQRERHGRIDSRRGYSEKCGGKHCKSHGVLSSIAKYVQI